MGYVPDCFKARVGKWMAAGWLPPSGKIADFGLQEFHGDQAEARRITMEFVRDHGVAESAVEQICSPTHALSVAEVYGALGHEYVAIDVQQARGVNFFDLNCFVAPNEWREVFDLVNNE